MSLTRGSPQPRVSLRFSISSSTPLIPAHVCFSLKINKILKERKKEKKKEVSYYLVIPLLGM